MKLTVIFTMLLLIIAPGMKAQELVETLNATASNAQDTLRYRESHNDNTTVKVNLEMIKRFQEVNTEGDIYSWSQLMLNHGHTAIRESLLSYRNADLNEQSMESIKLALEEKIRDTVPSQSIPEDEYFANINRIKQEINSKLVLGNQVAMK